MKITTLRQLATGATLIASNCTFAAGIPVEAPPLTYMVSIYALQACVKVDKASSEVALKECVSKRLASYEECAQSGHQNFECAYRITDELGLPR